MTTTRNSTSSLRTIATSRRKHTISCIPRCKPSRNLQTDGKPLRRARAPRLISSRTRNDISKTPKLPKRISGWSASGKKLSQPHKKLHTVPHLLPSIPGRRKRFFFVGPIFFDVIVLIQRATAYGDETYMKRGSERILFYATINLA